MNEEDLLIFAEVVWLLRTSPPPIGYNRKPLTIKQQKMIDELFSRISYPENYAEHLNKLHGQ